MQALRLDNSHFIPYCPFLWMIQYKGLLSKKNGYFLSESGYIKGWTVILHLNICFKIAL